MRPSRCWSVPRATCGRRGRISPTALATTRAGNLFTTHTAVAAGFDRFAPELIEQYLGAYAKSRLGISTEQLLALGRANPQDWSESFNMAYLAIRGSGAVSGVSRLHGEVSRQIFGTLFPRWAEDEVPVGHVTNGVHMPTWDSRQADVCGAGLRRGLLASSRWRAAAGIRRRQRCAICGASAMSRARALIESARARLARMLLVSGETPAEVAEGASSCWIRRC